MVGLFTGASLLSIAEMAIFLLRLLYKCLLKAKTVQIKQV